MSDGDDLVLGEHNNAETSTQLIAGPGDHGPGALLHFAGANILEVKPNPALLGAPGANHSAIFAKGVGNGAGVFAVGDVGVRGTSTSGMNIGVAGTGATGVRGDGSIGVQGVNNISAGFGTGVQGEGAVGVHGTSTAAGTGVRGDGKVGVFGTGTGDDSEGVHGIGNHGVRGEGQTGILGIGGGGPGIDGISVSDRAGKFTSKVAAQIHLVPLDGPSDPSQLPTPAKAGDLVALLHRRPLDQKGEEPAFVEFASLWFCTQGGAPGASAWTKLA
ncbi:hypothetical protein [Mycobacterium hubeiense]|uniref:hypothetical protein n=1 Tax=Mycobacterium hubeiense TaxID=1867256 RepID=UPI0011579945|nr:hypothetical protein [Mycobacterium sp. QGD 101]